MLKKIKIKYSIVTGIFTMLSVFQIGATVWNNAYAAMEPEFDLINSTQIQDSVVENHNYDQIQTRFYRLDDGSYAIIAYLNDEIVNYYNEDGSFKSSTSISGHVGYVQQAAVLGNGNIVLFGDNKLILLDSSGNKMPEQLPPEDYNGINNTGGMCNQNAANGGWILSARF